MSTEYPTQEKEVINKNLGWGMEKETLDFPRKALNIKKEVRRIKKIKKIRGAKKADIKPSKSLYLGST